MTEESTPLETTVDTEMPVDETAHADSDESTVTTDEAPPMESVLDSDMGNGAVSDANSAQETSEDLSDSAPSPEITTLKAQLEDRTSQYMRLAADFDNFRKRTSKEKIEFEERAKRQTIIELLPVIDNFERARSQIKPQSDAENNIQKSYQGIYKQLVDCLKQLGVSPMRPEGELFDPNLHEAVMREPTADYPEGTVIEELRRGYVLGEQVLRHAMVRVAAPPEESSSDTEDSAQNDKSSDA